MNYERLFDTDCDISCSSTARIVCLFTFRYHLKPSRSIRFNEAQQGSIGTIYRWKNEFCRGHENRCHTSNGDYLLTAAGRDAKSICYVRCVALHASKCNKYPSTCNTVAITFPWDGFSHQTAILFNCTYTYFQ